MRLRRKVLWSEKRKALKTPFRGRYRRRIHGEAGFIS